MRFYDDNIDEHDDRCPGCGCAPGDDVTPGCDEPAGCGFFALELEAHEVAA